MLRKRKAASDSVTALAREIRQLRTRLKMNQALFAREIGGVSQQTVSDWEKGKRLRPLQTALRLVRLLGK